MSAARVIALTSVALLAFAANSLLCRLALKQTSIDAASFTTIRMVAGAAVLCVGYVLSWQCSHLRGELAVVMGTLCLCSQLFVCVCKRAGIGRARCCSSELCKRRWSVMRFGRESGSTSDKRLVW